MTPPVTPVAERFWSKVRKGAGPNDCWLWLAGVDKDGYGKFWVGYGEERRAHAWAYIEANGPIAAGLVIDHLCRIRNCVRPLHLEAVTNHVNQLRGWGFSGINARKTHCPIGHPLDEANTYVNPRGNRGCRICAIEQKRLRRAQMTTEQRLSVRLKENAQRRARAARARESVEGY